ELLFGLDGSLVSTLRFSPRLRLAVEVCGGVVGGDVDGLGGDDDAARPDLLGEVVPVVAVRGVGSEGDALRHGLVDDEDERRPVVVGAFREFEDLQAGHQPVTASGSSVRMMLRTFRAGT